MIRHILVLPVAGPRRWTLNLFFDDRQPLLVDSDTPHRDARALADMLGFVWSDTYHGYIRPLSAEGRVLAWREALRALCLCDCYGCATMRSACQYLEVT